MKTVLYPAIALMNRLSFGMKFGLISVLFFLPLLITSFYLVRDAYRQFSDTRIELQSLTLLGSGLQIRRSLESLNDLLQINAVIGQSGKAGDLEARIADVQKGLRGRLEALAPLSEDGAAVADSRPSATGCSTACRPWRPKGPCRARAHGRRSCSVAHRYSSSCSSPRPGSARTASARCASSASWSAR